MKKLLMIVSLFFISAWALMAQTEKQILQFEAFPDKMQVAAGEEVNVLVWMKIDKAWHTYPLNEQDGSTPTEFTLENEDAFEQITKIYAQEPKVKYDSIFQTDVEYYQKKAFFVVVLKAKKDIDFSKDKINLLIKIQQCDDATCLDGNFTTKILSEVAAISADMLAEAREYSITYDADAGYPIATYDAAEKVTEEPTATEEESAVEDGTKESTGFWGMILMAMFNGLVSIFMPCIFPMIPITVSFFLKRSEEGGNGLRDATTYALGIVGTFTLFGFLVALLMKVANIDLLSMVSTPWFNIAIVIIFVFFGLSLLGAYEIQAPTSITNKLDSKSRSSKGIMSVLLMSVVFSLASFSCTGPFISAALVSAIEHGSWLDPLISMAAFSAVLASPFFLLALSPKALTKVNAGAWMNNVKIVLGFVVLVLSTKYLATALASWGIEIPRNMIMAFYAGAGLLMTLYILGVWKSKHDAPVDSLGTPRILFAVLFALITFYFISGFSGQSMGFFEGLLPARTETSMTAGGVAVSAINWEHDYEAALAKAKEEGKNVFVDFTGMACTNCKKMEGDMFPRPAVVEAINQYVAVKLYTDKRGEEYEANKNLRNNTFHSYANPLYVIVTPEGKEIARANYTSSEADYLEFLSKGK